MKWEFDSRAQSFSLDAEGFGKLRFKPRAEVDGELVRFSKWKLCTGGLYEAKSRHGTWELRLGRGEVTLSARLSEKAGRALLVPVCFEAFEAEQILSHGRKMGGCGGHLLKGDKALAIASEFWMAITRKGRTLLLAHPIGQRDLSSLAGSTQGSVVKEVSAFTRFDPCDRKRLRSAPVSISLSADGHQLMTDWAAAQVDDRPLADVPQESGWNSWDYYRWTITEEEVCKNAELIASDPVLSKHVKRIIVDDGWQYCYGEWEPNPLFPSGMEGLAKTLAKMGFTPGLWFAPTIAEPHSRVAQLYPEMLACGLAGVPCLAYSCMERNGFILDPTHPRVIAWWKEIFGRYAACGYRYFKLDFLSWTLRARRFHRKSAGPGELMRHILEPIREAVGPQSRILGCNFNFEMGRWLPDEVRVGSDIHASWRYVKKNVHAIGSRFWSHRRLWINDPDFAVCRGKETSADPDLHRLKLLLPYVKPGVANRELAPGLDAMDSLANLSAREAQTWLSLVIVSGGAVNLSDNLTRLNEAGLQMLRKTVAAEKGEAGVPLDLFVSELPAYWVQNTRSGLHRVLLVNWGEARARFELDLHALNLPSLKIRDFWSGAPAPVKRGRIATVLPPHGCLLVECRN